MKKFYRAAHVASIALLLALLGSACNGDDLSGTGEVKETKTLLVQSYQAECTGLGLQLCMLVKEEGKNRYSPLYDGIEGFTYEWDYQYELRVEETAVRNPPEDGSSVERRLVEIVSKEAAPSAVPFQLTLSTVAPEDGRQIITQETENLFGFHNAKAFTCASAELCTEFADLVEQNLRIEVEFIHPVTPGEPLVAQRILSTEELKLLF